MTTREMRESISKNGQRLHLLTQFHVNDHFQIGVYEGTLSEFDIVIKYKQLIEGEWTLPRTPKHIHWAVDILIKQHAEPEETNNFLGFLLDYWENVTPFMSTEERADALNVEHLMAEVDREASQYREMARVGEYSVKFLILLAKLLMKQEKTNNHEAYMFRRLLEQLREHSNIFGVVSTATLNRRR